MTAVFFSNHMDDFHTLMSPASPICRDTSGKLISDILRLRHARRNNVITPETLFLLNEFPLIEKSAWGLAGEEDTQCDLLLLTAHIGVGMEKFIPNEFRYSNPYEKIGDVLREAIRLLA